MTTWAPNDPINPTLYNEPNRPGASYNPTVIQQIAGPEGPRGPQGLVGDRGPQGIAGPPGDVSTAQLDAAIITRVSKAGGDTITASDPAVVPLTLRGAVGQTQNLLDILKSDGSAGTIIDNEGHIFAFRGVSAFPYDNASSSFYLRTATGHTHHLLECQRPDGTKFGVRVDNNGNVYTPRLGVGGFLPSTLARAYIGASTATDRAMILRGAVNQSANIQEWRDGADAVLAQIQPSGDFATQKQIKGRILYLGPTLEPDSWYGGMQQITTAGASVKGLIVRGTASQSANLAEIQNSAGTRLVEVQSDGFSIFYSGGILYPFGPGFIGFRIIGNASQTGDLLQFRNSAGTVQSRFSANGRFGFSAAHELPSAALPATPLGYMIVEKSDGVSVKVPYYTI